MKKFKYKKYHKDSIIEQYKKNCFNGKRQINDLLDKIDEMYYEIEVFTDEDKLFVKNAITKIDKLYLKIGKHAIIVLDRQERIKKFGEKVHEKSKKEKDENLGGMLKLSNKIIKD